MQHVRTGREGTDFPIQKVITHLMGILIAIMAGLIAHCAGYAGMFAVQSGLALGSFLYTLHRYKTAKQQ